MSERRTTLSDYFPSIHIYILTSILKGKMIIVLSDGLRCGLSIAMPVYPGDTAKGNAVKQVTISMASVWVGVDLEVHPHRPRSRASVISHQIPDWFELTGGI